MVVTVWSGRETLALRTALRMTFEAIAEHLGVAVRTVAKWEAQGPKIVPSPGIQDVLDAALERATPAQQSRFQMLLEETSAPDERVKQALERPASVDLVTVARLRQGVQDLDARYDRSPSISLLAETAECLGRVARLSVGATTGVVRRELHALEAECATLMGQLVGMPGNARTMPPRVRTSIRPLKPHASWATGRRRGLPCCGRALSSSTAGGIPRRLSG